MCLRVALNVGAASEAVNPESDYLLSFSELKSKRGVRYSRVHIDRLERQNAFPQRVKLSPGPRGACGWWASEIDRWLASLPRGIASVDSLIAE
jgi:predicted DNA-binding transcriptional regulator AlpA